MLLKYPSGEVKLAVECADLALKSKGKIRDRHLGSNYPRPILPGPPNCMTGEKKWNQAGGGWRGAGGGWRGAGKAEHGVTGAGKIKSQEEGLLSSSSTAEGQVQTQVGLTESAAEDRGAETRPGKGKK